MKLSKKNILKEMVVFKEDDDYIAKHPNWDTVAGVGNTPEEAIQLFKELLNEAWKSLVAGRTHPESKPKVGRPALGRDNFNMRLLPSAKAFLKQIAKEQNVSVGVLIEQFLVEKYGFKLT